LFTDGVIVKQFGSMNFDVRSRRLNTEMGLIIHNAELAQQEARHISDSQTEEQKLFSRFARG